MAKPGHGGTLRGRASECGLLDGLIADVRRGEGRSLVLRGDAGIGKTALLEYLIESASEMTVLRAVGVESEMELAYASLHQLCVPLLERLDGLPAPQREAVEIVFGLRAGPPPDRFLVGLGILSLLSEAAERHPLLCVVDDAQWLDQASALTLAFVARRLLAERAGIVFATRDPDHALKDVSEFEVRGVRNGDARALLDSAVRFKLDERVRDRIIAEVRGNPLALLELPRGLTATQLAGGFGLVEQHGLSGRLEESFIRRMSVLPDDTRLLLVIAAAEPVGDPLLLWAAAERLEISPSAAEAAEADELLTIGERVIFRHPLVRSAVYGSASPEDRRAVHLALAEATDREADPDRRAWHLAAATTSPDDVVATELERSAGRAQARGGVAAAAAFLKRAVALTRDPQQRGERALAAAQAHLQAGAFDTALQLLTTAEAWQLDKLGQARADLIRGQVEFATNGGRDALAMLLKAARQLEALDPALARETYLDAWAAAMLADTAGGGDLLEVATAALAAPQPSGAPRASDLLLEGLSLAVCEGGQAAAKLHRAVSAFADEKFSTAELRWGYLATVAANMTWDLDSAYAISSRQLQAAREAGSLAYLQMSIYGVGMVATRRGEFGASGSLIAEADAVSGVTGARHARYAAVFLAGCRGREGEASALIEAEIRNALAVGQRMGKTYCQWVSAILYNGLGQYEKALAEAQSASEVRPELGLCSWVRVELIEAATRTSHFPLARETLERLSEAASAGETDWGLGVLARSRALVSDGQSAERFYLEAIERLARTQLKAELARAYLVYGEWLRRENRRLDAREQLHVAYRMFAAIGMEAFAERTRTELQATGEHVRRRTVETRDDLTAQERQIAELARDGLSNPEIGARLFLSPRTVEWHLRHVFAKLNIKSRRELSNLLLNSNAETISE